MMDKMNVKQQAEVRANLYGAAIESFRNINLDTEAICDGLLIHLPDGYFAKMKISICDATKFDLTMEREAYAEKLQKQSERAEAARLRAEEKARKAAEKAAKAAEKTL